MKTHLPVLPTPHTILFDWHGTLVDTQDAMTAAMEEMLDQMEDLALVERLVPESACRNEDDVKLVRFIRIFRRLHPKILLERRSSRTEIFKAIFGNDLEAKALAHRAYNKAYRNYYGKVKPIQDGIRETLAALQRLGLNLGVATNRSREFLEHELRTVDDGSWPSLLKFTTCADDVTHYKPDPQVIRYALASIDKYPKPDTWYIGDSATDMETARRAGVTPILYNSACRDHEELWASFDATPELRPYAIIDNFDQLMDLLQNVQTYDPVAFQKLVSKVRPHAFAGPQPPPVRVEPDWHPSVARLLAPRVVVFDWHATLVDTLDAMYHAVDDMLPELREMGLLSRLVDPATSKSPEDARLVEYVQAYAQLHPKIKADRKISRTDIFEVLFGEDQDAKHTAHQVFNKHYRNHFGNVQPFEPRVREVLLGLKRLGIRLGVITNRDREFFEHEVGFVESGSWLGIFDSMVCGDDTSLRKPHPDQVWLAAKQLGCTLNDELWYVGDSTTDVVAARTAGITSVFFNGAQWDQEWLNKIFPGNERYPHRPHVVVNDFAEFWALVLACLQRQVARVYF